MEMKQKEKLGQQRREIQAEGTASTKVMKLEPVGYL